MSQDSYNQGIKGENRACLYLQQQNFKILERNFHSQQGEIDIVARDGEFLVFIEVKNYSFRSLGSPLGAIRKSKKESIIHAAQTYLYKNGIKDTNCRFDVISIYRKFNGQTVIDHIKDAFYAR
jgi:putative endonuclease